MQKIDFSKEEKALMVEKLQRYFAKELDQELGEFDAEFLLDFFADEMGAFFYNRGLYDAEAALSVKVEEISESLMQLERPVTGTR